MDNISCTPTCGKRNITVCVTQTINCIETLSILVLAVNNSFSKYLSKK